MSVFKTPSKTLLEIAETLPSPPTDECKRAAAGFITPPKYGPGPFIQPAWDGEQVSLTVPRRGGKQKKQRRSKGVNKRRLGGVVRCLDDDFLLIDVQEREMQVDSSTAREVREKTLKTLKDEGKSTKHIFGCSRCRWSMKGCVDSKTNPKAKGCRRAEGQGRSSGAD